MLILRRKAERNIQQAYTWYESRQMNLGVLFLEEIESVLYQIETLPNMFPKVENDIRRALCRKFPYTIYFIESDTDVVVLSVLHQKQDSQFI